MQFEHDYAATVENRTHFGVASVRHNHQPTAMQPRAIPGQPERIAKHLTQHIMIRIRLALHQPPFPAKPEHSVDATRPQGFKLTPAERVKLSVIHYGQPSHRHVRVKLIRRGVQPVQETDQQITITDRKPGPTEGNRQIPKRARTGAGRTERNQPRTVDAKLCAHTQPLHNLGKIDHAQHLTRTQSAEPPRTQMPQRLHQAGQPASQLRPGRSPET